ncbi:Uncharacterised protein [Burkholderia pseudomallei]|nr:Uncharacterised protein [Burkholderia pseudomallei]
MRFFKKPGCAAQRCDVDGSRLERRVSGAWRLQCRRFVCLACLATARARARHRIPVSIHALGRVACGSAPRTSDRDPSTLNFERSANHRRRTHCRSLWSLLRRACKTRPDDFRSASTREASRPKPSMRRRTSRRGAPAPLFIAPRVPRTFVQHPHHTFNPRHRTSHRRHAFKARRNGKRRRARIDRRSRRRHRFGRVARAPVHAAAAIDARRGRPHSPCSADHPAAHHASMPPSST